MSELQTDYEKADLLQKAIIGFVTKDEDGGTDQDYASLRRYFLDNPVTKPLIPNWVRVNRNANQIWQFMQPKFATYAERRQFVWSELNSLVEHCESNETFPAEQNVSHILKKFDETGVNAAWQISLQRKTNDPEGAITIARTILESVCKHILDDLQVSYDPKKIELPQLYKKVATELNLSPSQHTEEVFKQILGGCSSIVNGLGVLRNRLGDAHGQGSKPVRPAARHAELAVNLAGTMALFIVETYLNMKKSNEPDIK